MRKEPSIRLVSYEKNLAIVCDPQAPNETRTEPYLVAKYLKNKTANDKYGAFGTELERPVKVFKAKPKDWSQWRKDRHCKLHNRRNLNSHATTATKRSS